MTPGKITNFASHYLYNDDNIYKELFYAFREFADEHLKFS